MAAQHLWDQSEKVSKKRDAVRRELDVLKVKYSALIRRLHGATLTSAEPPKEGKPR